MTVAKRDKKKRGRPPKNPPPLEKNIEIAPSDKMIRNCPNICLHCNIPSFYAMCEHCGRFTIRRVITKGG